MSQHHGGGHRGEAPPVTSAEIKEPPGEDNQCQVIGSQKRPKRQRGLLMALGSKWGPQRGPAAFRLCDPRRNFSGSPFSPLQSGGTLTSCSCREE